MKKLFLLLAFAFSTCIFAQDGTMKTNSTTTTKATMQKKDHVMMKDGKMWVMKDGKTMAMDKDMTMSNGTMVSSDGKVTMSDGKTSMMKNGDWMDMNGMMGNHMKKDKSKM